MPSRIESFGNQLTPTPTPMTFLEAQPRYPRHGLQTPGQSPEPKTGAPNNRPARPRHWPPLPPVLADDDADDQHAEKKPQLTPEEIRAKQQRELEEKQRRYEEARAKIFGESNPSSGASSPSGTVTPPRGGGGGAENERGGGRGRGRGRGRGGGGGGGYRGTRIDKTTYDDLAAVDPTPFAPRAVVSSTPDTHPEAASGCRSVGAATAQTRTTRTTHTTRILDVQRETSRTSPSRPFSSTRTGWDWKSGFGFAKRGTKEG
ncbi:hypothetical protein HER10_EVM0002889 [Colletotrichum scovillei]|uniref:uncharacterized protein n=1 Tax=Colletotrichum scovillei TaxID=1209932 RepID=UPI0015C38767|nr:uncharacterized protein HER10_EVM0002889 [Colletotrichum scovillei]KAF4784005.1 hypothetical protein HER10_EVM0002889 [Colletotrichum scovillei]